MDNEEVSRAFTCLVKRKLRCLTLVVKKATSLHSRVKIVKAIKDPHTGERVERQDETPDPKKDESGNFAFILKKETNEKFPDDEDSSEIDIVNPRLWDLLKKHLEDYPYHKFRGPSVTIDSPYEAIIFKWDILKKVSAEEPNDPEDRQAREDLGLLLDILSSGSSGDSKLDKYFKNQEAYLREYTVQFDDLWTIFPPGTLVYGKPFQGQDQLFIVQDNTRAWPESGDRPPQLLPWQLRCWTYDWNGVKFQRTSFTLLFEQFEGYRPIESLAYRPFDPDKNGDIKAKLIERGKIFRRLCTAKEEARLFEYEGDTIFGKKGFTGLVQGDEVGYYPQAYTVQF